jgi:hypothetical protein
MSGIRFWTRVQLTLARQSETVGSTTGLGGRDEADQDGGNLAGFYRGSFAARGRSKRANRTVRSAHSAGVATGRHGRRQSGPGPTVAATRAGLSAQSAGTGWCLSALFPGPQCGAGMHGNLRAGIPAERHGDCASHELLLARRLGPFPFRLNRNGGEAGTGSPASICATQVLISCSCRRHCLRFALRRGLAARGASASPSSASSSPPPLIFQAVPAGPLAKRDGRKKTDAGSAPVLYPQLSVSAVSGRSRAQLQFLNFQDLSFHGVSVSTRHCSHRSGGQ